MLRRHGSGTPTPRTRHGGDAPPEESGSSNGEEGRHAGRNVSSNADPAEPSPNSPAVVGGSIEERQKFLRTLSNEEEYQAMLLSIKDIVRCGSRIHC